MITKEIFKKLATNRGKHVAMWQWIRVTGKTKEDFFKEMEIDEIDVPFQMCYACQEAFDRMDTKEEDMSVEENFCSKCPLCENGNSGANCLDGLYLDYIENPTPEKASEIMMLEWSEQDR